MWHSVIFATNALPFLLTFLLAAFALGCSNPPPANDAAPWHEPRAEGDAPEVVLTSHYVAMQDGVQLAVDVYRPAGLAPDSRLPTLVQQTRYWRAADMRPPISWLGESHGEQIEAFVAAGWAVVSADIRGTGASYGTRPYPWARDEIRDGGDLAAWVVAQSWSDGRLATPTPGPPPSSWPPRRRRVSLPPRLDSRCSMPSWTLPFRAVSSSPTSPWHGRRSTKPSMRTGSRPTSVGWRACSSVACAPSKPACHSKSSVSTRRTATWSH
ncbi:MAG: CocE/NonD family hydrolase [Deltaproteobacteria bacterium]|nr:CocE/NonD family hydrolase [Deltaproteobacteria bacterium]